MATIDSSIPFRAFQQQNVLESFYKGKRMRRQGDLGDLQVRSAVQGHTARMLAQGVLDSDNPARDYPLALRQAEEMGEDISSFPETYGEEAQMRLRMIVMPEGEQTEFQRLLGQLPPDQQQQALRDYFSSPTPEMRNARARFPNDPVARQNEIRRLTTRQPRGPPS